MAAILIILVLVHCDLALLNGFLNLPCQGVHVLEIRILVNKAGMAPILRDVSDIARMSRESLVGLDVVGFDWTLLCAVDCVITMTYRLHRLHRLWIHNPLDYRRLTLVHRSRLRLLLHGVHSRRYSCVKVLMLLLLLLVRAHPPCTRSV